MDAIHDTTSRTCDNYFTTTEAAALLPGVSPRTVQRWAKSGRIDSERLPGGQYRIPAAAVESLPTVARTS